jgi:hypothetical protein
MNDGKTIDGQDAGAAAYGYGYGADVTNHGTTGTGSILGGLGHVAEPVKQSPVVSRPLSEGSGAPDTDLKTDGRKLTTDSAPAKPPIEFFAVDRFHAMTRMHSLYLSGVARGTVKAVVDLLEHSKHVGPVHVAIDVPENDAARNAESDGHAAPAGKFTVRPFQFVRV